MRSEIVSLRFCPYMWNMWLNVGSMRRKLGEMRLRVDVRRVWKENLRLNKEQTNFGSADDGI